MDPIPPEMGLYGTNKNYSFLYQSLDRKTAYLLTEANSLE
jgi:hypothetical protein